MSWEEEGTARLCERRREATMAVAVAWTRMREAGGHCLQRRAASRLGYMSLFYAWIKEKAKLHYWFLKFNY